ncbi:MAG: AAA family ATPase [Romboutsia sp.]
MNINKVRVRNYKSFIDSGEIDIDSKLFALIGQNNTGKSAIMDAIQCMFPSCKKTITALDFHKGASQIIIEVWFDGATQSYLEEKLYEDKIIKQEEKLDELHEKFNEKPIPSNKEKIEKQIKKIEDTRNDNHTKCIEKYDIQEDAFYIKLIAAKGKNVSKKFYTCNEKELSEADIKQLLPQLKVIPAIRDPKNESTAGANSYLKELIQMVDDEMQTSIEIDGSNISYKELNRVIADETKSRCKSIGENITNFYNQAIGTNDYEVIIDSDVNISKGTTFTTKIKDVNTGIESDILNCGTGYQSMIILSILETYVKISQRQNTYILLIEEPEVYLHPKLQRKMIDTLVNISETNQVLFTSHSPITVSKLSKEQIKLVIKEKGVATIEDINPKVVIDELGIKSDDILTHKGIIFVEGKDDKAIFEIVLEKIEEGLSEKINVIDAGKCQDLKFYANAELLINNRFSTPTLIVRDTDTKESSKRREELANEIINQRNNKPSEEIQQKIKESIVILDRYSLEGYFIDEKLLEVLDINSEDIGKAVKCYECQYDHYSKQAHQNIVKESVVSSWYQPKYFLERFTDKFKASETDKINQHNERYETKWINNEVCATCEESDIDTYISTRTEINNKSNNLKLEKKDYLIESIKNKDIEYIKQTKLNEIVNILENFTEGIC